MSRKQGCSVKEVFASGVITLIALGKHAGAVARKRRANGARTGHTRSLIVLFNRARPPSAIWLSWPSRREIAGAVAAKCWGPVLGKLATAAWNFASAVIATRSFSAVGRDA